MEKEIPVEEEIKSSDVLEHEISIEELPVDSSIAELTQSGNYLIGVTNQGVKFRQRIPNNKILNRVKGKFVFQDMEIAQ